MAITYGFYNSMNGDRKYDAVQLSSIFDGVIRDGVFQSIGGYLATKPGTGMQVLVSPGKAWFDHTWTVNDADLPLDISQSDVTLSRYDAVVLETDATKSVRENSIKVIKGTPASAPQKPTLTNEGDVHQHPLAYILVPGGSTEIQVQNIDIMVGKTECPFVTSILESVSIEALLEKWEGEFKTWMGKKENDFQTWFDDLQSQMEGDVATNLQNQINKINQTTATEETKSLYGVPSDGTPDDVFQAINSIGDIKITTRSDLSDHWLLCNGERFSPEEYPGLNSFFSQEAIDWQDKSISSPDLINPILNISFCNGFWFLHLSDALYFSSAVGGPWKKCNLPDSTIPRAVIFFNGKYYGFSGIQIREATSPDSQWVACPNIGTISGISSKNHKCKPVACGNKVVSIIRDNSDGQAVPIYTSDPSSGGWVRGNGISPDVRIADCDYGVYHGGTVVFATSSTSTSGASGVICKNIDDSSPTFERSGPRTVGYVDGKWIYGSATLHAVDSIDDPRDELNKITDTAVYPGIVCEVDDSIIIRGRNGKATIITKSGYKDCGTISAGKATTSTMGGYAASDGTKVAAIGTVNGSLSMPSDLGLTKTIGTLPTVSIDGAYAYIRGK